MNWSRVKTILICCLLAVDLVLLSVWAVGAYRTHRQEELDRDHLRSALEARGVSVAAHVELPGSQPQGQEILLEQDEDREWELARTLLGDATREEGGIYTGAEGMLRFRGGGYLELSCRTLSAAAAKEAFSVPQEELSAGSISQQWNGCPVYNSGLTVTEGTDGSVSVAGRWLIGTVVGESQAEVHTASTVLLRYADRYGAEAPVITGLEQGYTVQTEAPGYLRLSPVWRISTDEGDVYFSAVTGEEETLG